MKLLLVFLFGGAGSVLRLLVGQWLPAAPSGGFPWATFVCNVAGCLLIGLFSRLALADTWRLAVTVGLCGGFTTFSTFSRESLALMQSGHTGVWFTYVAASLVAGVGAVWAATSCGS